MAIMEKCFQMGTPRACVLQHSHRRFTSMDKPSFTNILKPPMKASAITSSSSAHSFNLRSRIICKAAVNQVQVVTDGTWNEMVEAAEMPVLVEFWAPWCGPCRMIAPVVDELAKEYAGKALCYKINTDDCPNIASKYGISKKWREHWMDGLNLKATTFPKFLPIQFNKRELQLFELLLKEHRIRDQSVNQSNQTIQQSIK